MAVQWYCKIGDQELGPITAELLKQLAEQGQLRPDSSVRSGAAGEWVAARRVRGLFSTDGSQAGVPTASSSPGQPVDSGSKVAASGAPTSRGGQSIKRAKPLVPPQAHESGVAKPPASHGPKPPPPRISDSAQIPMGVPVGAAVTPAAVVTTPEGAGSILSDRGQRLMERRKDKRPLVLVAALGGAVLVVGLAGGGLLLLRGSGKDSPQLTASPEHTDSRLSLDPERDPEESDPEAEQASIVPSGEAIEADAQPPGGRQAGQDAALAATSRRNAADGSRPSAAGESAGALQKADQNLLAAIKEIRKWADASRVRIRSGTAEVRIMAAWLDQESELLGGNAGSSDSLVCIQVSVANSAKDNLIDYSSWNGSGILQAEAQAALLGANNVLLPLVPLEQTRSLEDRQTSVAVEPGQAVQDVLVFRALAGPAEDLRLVLPRSALGGTGHIGFTVPKVMLVGGSRPKRGAQSDENLAANAPDSAQPASAGDPAEPAPAAPMLAPAVGAARGDTATGGPPQPEQPAADSPPTFEDLKRSIEGEPQEKPPQPSPPQPSPPQPSQPELES